MLPSASRRVGVALPVTLLLALGAVGPVGAAAEETPSPTLLTATPGATATSLDGLSAPVRSFTPPEARDIITSVASLDGAEEQQDTDTERTVILDSSVLFPEDRATLTPAARARLKGVARQIRAAKATGVVRIDGYTDDQGSAQHGLVLSRQRAAAVRGVLAPVLAGIDVRLVTRGLGEANPRVPNADRSGRPIPRNQAKNRRVEISFAPAAG